MHNYKCFVNKGWFVFLFCLTFELIIYRANADYSNSEIINLVKKFANNSITEAEKAVLFANNTVVNNLAMSGKISKSEYNLVQSDFAKKNDEIISKVAERYGLSVSTTKIQIEYKPGTDTDRQIQGINRKVTVNDIINVREAYNREVENYLRTSGIKTKENTNWAKVLKTDIMPSPFEMSANEFKIANEYLNRQGGVAYTNADAAKVQVKLESGLIYKPTIYEARSYFVEMQEKIKMMNDEIRDLKVARLSTKNTDALENIDIEIRKRNAYIAKYLERMNKISDYINSNSINENQGNLNEKLYNVNSEKIIKDAQIRDSSKIAQNSEVVVSSIQQKLAFNSMRRFNENIIQYGITNGNLDEAVDIVANNIKNLNPNTKSQIINDLEVKYGNKLAQEVVKALKTQSNTNLNESNVLFSRSIANKIGAINTIANIGSQYIQGKTTTQIIWDMTLGNLENLANQTAKYTNAEIESLKLQYAMNGENPESVFTKLKIMSHAILKGTFYGTMIGGYELFKLTSKSAAGLAINLAENLIFLSGEIIDTINTLDETKGNLQVQSIEQKVQDEKAILIAKDILSELRELSRIKENYEITFKQNILVAKEFVSLLNDKIEQSENVLKSFKIKLEDLNKVNIADTLSKVNQDLSHFKDEINKLDNEVNVLQKLLEKKIYNSIEEIKSQVDKAYKWFSSIKSSFNNTNNQLFKIKDINQQSFNEVKELFTENRKQINAIYENAQTKANVINQNIDNYKKLISIFQEKKSKILKANKYFVEKRESNEFDWMAITIKLNEIVEPSLSDIPSDLYYYLNTIKNVKDETSSKIKTLDNEYKTLCNTYERMVDKNFQSDISNLLLLALNLQTKLGEIESRFVYLYEILDNIKPNIFLELICPSETTVKEKFVINISIKDPDGRFNLGNCAIDLDFGDGSKLINLSNLSVGYTYKNPGNYKVSAKIYPKNLETLARNHGNLYAQASKYVTVKEKTSSPTLNNNNLKLDNTTNTKNRNDDTSGANNINKQRLPCGHLPGECPKSGIGALKCSLSKGKISQNK